MSTEIKNMATCPGCDKHCPVGQFQCGKGNRIFGQADMDTEASHEHRKHHEHNEGTQHRHRKHHHGREAHPSHEGHHGHCGAHHERKWWDAENSDDLSVLLGKCGHHVAKHSGRGQGQKNILRILAEEESISQRKLQEILDIKPGSISEILTKLETKGFLIRKKSETDKRAVMLRITEAGKAAATLKAEPIGSETIFDCLNEEEKNTLQQLLKKLLNAWYSKMDA